jgi:hypothetical protein
MVSVSGIPIDVCPSPFSAISDDMKHLSLIIDKRPISTHLEIESIVTAERTV